MIFPRAPDWTSALQWQSFVAMLEIQHSRHASNSHHPTRDCWRSCQACHWSHLRKSADSGGKTQWKPWKKSKLGKNKKNTPTKKYSDSFQLVPTSPPVHTPSPPAFLWLSQTALECPFNELAVTKLDMTWILLHKLIYPIKVALLRQTNGKNALFLPRRLGSLSHIRNCSCRKHVTCERQGLSWNRTQVHFQWDIPVGDGRVQHLSTEILWNLLWFGCTATIDKQAHCVLVWAPFLQIHHQCNSLISQELLSGPSAILAVGKETFGIKANVVSAIC